MKIKLHCRWNYYEDENVEGNFKFVMNRMIISAENLNECIVLWEGWGVRGEFRAPVDVK